MSRPAHDRGGAAPGATATRVPWTSPWVLLATCLGVGRVPVAPGTAGAALGVPLAVATGAAATWLAGSGGPSVVTLIEAVVVASLCVAGVPICGRAAALLGRGKDPGAVVYDELVAVPVVLLMVPPAARTPACLAAAFVLFRIFDVAKPWPCRRLELLPAGRGIVADDLAAAAWAAACLAVARGLGLV